MTIWRRVGASNISRNIIRQEILELNIKNGMYLLEKLVTKDKKKQYKLRSNSIGQSFEEVIGMLIDGCGYTKIDIDIMSMDNDEIMKYFKLEG